MDGRIDGWPFAALGAACAVWMLDAGLQQTRVEHLNGPGTMVIRVK
jgi:hypothetical protein